MKKINQFILLVVILTLYSCGTNITEKIIEEQVPFNNDPKVNNDIGNDDFEETGIEISNPTSPTEVPKPKDDLDGIEFSNPELPSKSQKGPFYMDSDVFIQEISIDDFEFKLTGNIYIDRVKDNLGSFTLPSDLGSPYLEIRVNGYYFNEVSGSPSDGTISLGSYSSIKDGNAPNINILTTLAQKRIKHLVEEENFSFEDAEIEAKREVLRAFSIFEEIPNFDELRIDGNTSGDAILLAISVILQGELSTVELSNFIAKIREDLRSNGFIDNEDILKQICQQTVSIDPYKIRKNLKEYYTSLGLNHYQIPLFEDYLDSNCNNSINKYELDTYISFQKIVPELFENSPADDYLILYPYQDSIIKFTKNTISHTNDWKNYSGIFKYDFNLEYPIIKNWNNQIYLFGGRDCGAFNEEDICLDSMGLFAFNENLSLRKLKLKGFNDRYSTNGDHVLGEIIDNDEDYIEAYLNEDREDNQYPNFSSFNHSIRIINNKLYVVSKNNNNLSHIDFFLPGSNPHYYPEKGFYGSRVSDDGITWYSDELSNFIEEDYLNSIVDLIEFNDNIFLLTVHADVIKLNYQEDTGFSREYIRIDDFDSPSGTYLSFYKYKSDLFILNEENDGAIKIKYSRDGYNWHDLLLSNIFFRESLWSEPFEYQEMVHFVSYLTVNILTDYTSYKNYMGLIGEEE
jgi:hypothetical protein